MTLETNYSAIEEQKENEMEANPDLYNGSFTYAHYTTGQDTHLYKSLSTVGDFYCKIWYRNEEFDDDRVNGERNVIIVGTPEGDPFIGDAETIHRYLDMPGSVFVNAQYRQQLTDLTYSNRDLKDCVKFLSACIGKYNGNKDTIKLVDTNDNELTYSMVYDEEALTLEVTNSDAPLTLTDTFPNTMSEDSPIKQFGTNIAGEASAMDGAVNKIYNTVLGSGPIGFDNIKGDFQSGDNSISQYYRGGNNIGNISQNNNIPTSGTISWSNFRNACNKIEANCSGNFDHLEARWEIYGNDEWVTKTNKTVILSGHCGTRDQNQPAIRFNNSGGGNTIEFKIIASGRVYGWAGSPAGYNLSQGPVDGSGTLTNGGPGGYAIHLASSIKIGGEWAGSIKGGGGGGGKGGQGGQGGCGGHGGSRRCNGSFCWNTKRVCHRNGGQGGSGGSGGRGGWGYGYSWDPSAGWWVNIQGTHLNAPSGGQGGSGGSSRGGGSGGTGGRGGNGGGYEGPGFSGDTGSKGNNGGNDEHGCGFPCGKSGSNGAGGTPGGSPNGKYTTSHTGGRYQ